MEISIVQRGILDGRIYDIFDDFSGYLFKPQKNLIPPTIEYSNIAKNA